MLLQHINSITKTSPCNEDPLNKPHFYKAGVYRGMHYFRKLRLNFALKHGLWVLVRTASIHVLSKNKKNNQKISSENYHFYSREKWLYVAWACLHNVSSQAVSSVAEQAGFNMTWSRGYKTYFTLNSAENPAHKC